MGSIVSDILLRRIKYALFALVGAAVFCAAAKYLLPLERERAAQAAELDLLNRGNREREKAIAAIKKNRAEFANSAEFVKLTARRAGRASPGEVVFDFPDMRKSGGK